MSQARVGVGGWLERRDLSSAGSEGRKRERDLELGKRASWHSHIAGSKSTFQRVELATALCLSLLIYRTQMTEPSSEGGCEIN